MNLKQLKENIVRSLKSRLHGSKGEPYRFGNQTLRFAIGTRPIRTRYRNSLNANARNDALQVELVLKALNEGDVALDIGSHAGQYGVLMSSRCGPTGQVFCFEPDPDAVTRLQANFALNPQLKRPTVVAAACSDANGQATFFTQGGNAQSSLGRTALPTHTPVREITVPTLRVDDWWQAHGGTIPPKLIKIDTEGAEVHVLRGMPQLLASNALIVCELHPFAWEEFQVGLEELQAIVSAAGRTLSWLDGRGEVKPPAEYGTVLIA